MDKFILAMMIFIVGLLVIIGGGFFAVDYFKSHPEVFQIQPSAK